jgi:pentatricopeptide repeat protein
VYAQLGEVKKAIDTLREAVDAGVVVNFSWMKHDPDLDPLREDPEFIELVKGR